MAHLGRTVKNVEAPRPLKSQSRASLKNYLLIEELIQLIENVALTLQSGINNTEPMASLVQNLRIHGPQLETVSKDTLDRAFVVFRNASQDERLNIMTRLNLLELIELRAKGWEDNGFNSYYKTKQVTNVEIPDVHQQHQLQHQQHQLQHQHHHHNHTDVTQSAFLSTSPTFGAAAVGSAQQQQLLLGPGELIRNSGKFSKPTKIPGKTYCKDEVVIRNADSGKVMGIKGRRVHMIEELSETIISFQRVNPGAKERLVQITGPSEEKINYAKQLIEDTIRRNASPVRLEPTMGGPRTAGGGGGGSCSSLASSNSDETTPRMGGGGGVTTLANRLSLNSTQNFMTATAAAQQAAAVQQQAAVAALLAKSTSNAAVAVAAGEYKYTVNVGQHVIKITGDCCDLVRVAKLVLDDYFCSAEFLVSVEAGAAFDNSMVSPISTPSTPMGQPQFMVAPPPPLPPPLADSGIGLNYMAGQITNSANDGDDDVFIDNNGLASTQNNGLARSRRSHFSRKDSTPEANTANSGGRHKNEGSSNNAAKTNSDATRIIHEYEHLLYYAKSPHSWALPAEWQRICEKFPAIIRNKVTHSISSNASTFFRVAHNHPTTPTSNHNHNHNHNHSNNNNNANSANANKFANANFATVPSVNATPISNGSCPKLLDEKYCSMQLNIRRKGFFNRQSFSIDDDEKSAAEEQLLQKQQQQQQQQQPLHNYNLSTTFAAAAAAGGVDVAATATDNTINAPLTLNNFINNNNLRPPTPTTIKDTTTERSLLNKQIKIISAITENSAKKIEPSSLYHDEPILIEDSEDEVDKFNYDEPLRYMKERFTRSNSTSD